MKLLYNTSAIIFLLTNIGSSSEINYNEFYYYPQSQYHRNNNIKNSFSYNHRKNQVKFNYNNRYNKYDNNQYNYQQQCHNINIRNLSFNNYNNTMNLYNINQYYNKYNNNQYNYQYQHNSFSNHDIKENISSINLNCNKYDNNKDKKSHNINIDNLSNNNDNIIQNNISNTNLNLNKCENNQSTQSLNVNNINITDSFPSNNNNSEKKLNSLTLDLIMDQEGYRSCYIGKKEQVNPYRCTYKYYDNNMQQYNTIQKTFTDFNDFINNLAVITNDNFVVSSGSVSSVSQKELNDLGLPCTQTVGNKIFINGVKINNINQLRINGGSCNPILQITFKNIEHLLYISNSIKLEIYYIPLLSIIVKNTNNKKVEKSGNECNKSECNKQSNIVEEKKDKFEIIDNENIESNNKNFINMPNIMTKRYTILQSNVPIKCAKNKRYRKLVLFNSRTLDVKTHKTKNNIKVIPYSETTW